MYYVYALKSTKNSRIYIGLTSDLKQRVKEHNSGKGGNYTKHNYPFTLIFYEAFLAKKDAIKQEKFYKTGYGREVLNDKLTYSINCGVV